MKVTMLGCGASLGVPVIGCNCNACQSAKSGNKFNNRSRTSALIESETTKVVIDTGIDFKTQALKNGITFLDAIIYTHEHSDHTSGINDIRSVKTSGGYCNAYGTTPTLEFIKNCHPYLLDKNIECEDFEERYIGEVGFRLEATDKRGNFNVGDINFEYFEQIHDKTSYNFAGIKSLGLIINNSIAYSTDALEIYQQDLDRLRELKIKTWFVECLSYNKNKSHSHLDQTIQWINYVQPELSILIHMNHNLEYNELLDKLKQIDTGITKVVPAYDGLCIENNVLVE